MALHAKNQTEKCQRGLGSLIKIGCTGSYQLECAFHSFGKINSNLEIRNIQIGNRKIITDKLKC